MENDILNLLIEIREELRNGNRCPQFVCYIDLLNRCGTTREKLNTALNKLYVEKKIKVHNGLNDKLIEVINDNRGTKSTE